MPLINYNSHHIDDNDIKAVVSTLKGQELLRA